jgi:hypothetical protein
MVKDEPQLSRTFFATSTRLLSSDTLYIYGGDMSVVPTIDYLAVQSKAVPKNLFGVTRTEVGNLVTFKFGSKLPKTESWLETLAGSELNWLFALVSSPTVVQDTSYVDISLRCILAPRAGQKVVVEYATINSSDVEQFCAVVGNQGGSFKIVRNDNVQAPMDFAIVYLLEGDIYSFLAYLILKFF